jgi:hypothetical protein
LLARLIFHVLPCLWISQFNPLCRQGFIFRLPFSFFFFFLPKLPPADGSLFWIVTFLILIIQVDGMIKRRRAAGCKEVDMIIRTYYVCFRTERKVIFPHCDASHADY